MSLNADQILALAPDAASAKAGGQLAAPSKWSGLGRADGVLWGACQGSGKEPYRTQIALGEPAFKCSCPSRKFPCKHGLALYLLLAAQPALFTEQTVPQWVGDWLQARQQRHDKKSETAAATSASASTPELAAALASTQAAQARKREQQRAAKVARGLAELQTWLHDLAREGLATLRKRGPAYWDGIAARMVDAQAGALAGRLRRAGGLCFQTGAPDWEWRLGQELAAIYLLARAGQRLDQLPPGLREDTRALLGWSVNQEQVLAEPGVTARWLVLAQHSADDERVRVRTTWLRAEDSARWAQVLHFAVGNQGFDVPLSVGSAFDGELCFYPGAWPLRALIKQQDGLAPIAALPSSGAATLAQALDRHADALAANPFLRRFPLLLDRVRPDTGGRALLHGADGRQLTLHEDFRHHWQLLAISGGHPVTLVGEWDGGALLPLSVWDGRRLYNFESDFAL